MKKQDRSNGKATCVAINSVLTRIISEGSNEEAAGQRWNRGPSPLLLLSLSLSLLFSSCSSLVAAFTYIIIVMMIMTTLKPRSQWNPQAHRRVAKRFPRRRAVCFSFSSSRDETYYRVAWRSGRPELSRNSLPGLTRNRRAYVCINSARVHTWYGGRHWYRGNVAFIRKFE